MNFDASSYRLLWLTENFPPQRGGMAQSCDRIIRNIRAVGIHVDVVHLFSRSAHWKTEEKRQGTHWICPTRPDSAHALQRVWNCIENASTTMQWTHIVAFGGTLPLTAAPIFSAWLKIPLLLCIRGNDFDLGIFTPRRRAILNDACRQAAHICCVSQDKVHKMRALYPETSISWTPNGIEHEEWSWLPSEIKRAQTWRTEHVPQGRKVLGVFGHIKPKKGGLFFLQNLYNSGHLKDFHLLLVGQLDPLIQTWLEQTPKDLSYTSIDFLDRFELLHHYAALDMIVLPSFYDGTPNVVLEAAALGIPILGSTAGGIQDGLQHGEHGLFFPAGDSNACKEKIIQAAHLSEEKRLRMGTACKHWAHTQRTHIQERDRYLDIVQSTYTRSTHTE